MNEPRNDRIDAFRAELEAALAAAGGRWRRLAERIVSFGPRRCGPNVLVDLSPGDDPLPAVWPNPLPLVRTFSVHSSNLT